MKKENLERMSEAEIIQYAEALGIPKKAIKAANNKAEFVWNRWNQEVTVSAVGLDLKIPAKLLRDKDLINALANPNLTDDQADKIIMRLLGETQYNALIDACTDDEGVVDVVAMGVAFGRILSSHELKNL